MEQSAMKHRIQQAAAGFSSWSKTSKMMDFVKKTASRLNHNISFYGLMHLSSVHIILIIVFEFFSFFQLKMYHKDDQWKQHNSTCCCYHFSHFFSWLHIIKLIYHDLKPSAPGKFCNWSEGIFIHVITATLHPISYSYTGWSGCPHRLLTALARCIVVTESKAKKQ